MRGVRKLKKTVSLLVASSLVLLAFIGISYLSFSQSLSAHISENALARLQEVVQPNLISFNLQMEEQIKKVNTFADFLGDSGTLGNEHHKALLRAAVENNGLLRCAIAFPDGSFITHDNKNDGNVSNDAFFKANMKGEFFISDPRPAVVDSTKTVMLFSAPIKTNGRIIGSVIYSYLCDDMSKIFNLSFLDGKGQMFVAKQNGELLIGEGSYGAGQDNLLTYLYNTCLHQQHAAEECLVIQDTAGAYNLTLAQATSSLHFTYNKLPYNDWYLYSMVPEEVASKTIFTATGDQTTLWLSIIVCILLYSMLVLVLFFSRKNNIDKMTGTYTLDKFKRKAKCVLHHSGNHNYVFIKVDIKNFKLINRVYNHAEGDRVIRNMSAALCHVLVGEKNSLICHVGTDDFLLLLPYAGRELLNQQRQQFITQFRKLMGPEFTSTVEFPTGQYVLSPNDFPHPDITEILEKVNFAHRAAKTRTVNGNIVDYVETIEKDALTRKMVEDKMAHALETKRFQLYLQPKVRVLDGSVCGAEALVRWMEDDVCFMHPVDFIPILERNGFIVKLDMYMFRSTVQKLREMMDTGEAPVPISVNFSRFHLLNEDFVAALCQITDEYDVPRCLLEVELTESVVFENVTRISALIDELHAAGFTLSMDDFGSGYSCLALLKDLQVDILKIDKNFFDAANDTSRSRVVISNVLRMAQDLHITTVAEGIEVKQQVDMLREMGCDVIQGFYYFRPMPADEFHFSLPLPMLAAKADASTLEPSEAETPEAETP